MIHLPRLLRAPASSGEGSDRKGNVVYGILWMFVAPCWFWNNLEPKSHPSLFVFICCQCFLKLCVSYTRPPWQLGSHFLLLFLHEEQAEASQDKDQTNSTESEPGKKAEDTEAQPCFRSTFGSHWQQLIDIWSLGQGWGVCDRQPCSFFTLNGDLMSKSWQQQVSHVLY